MPNVCDYCGKNFSTKQRLDYHLNKNVCNKGENTMTELQKNTPVTPIYLFDEQKKEHAERETVIYKCGNCGNKSETKFTKCNRCGVENEF